MKIWGISARRYKGRGTPESEVREDILVQLAAAAPWLDLDAYRDQLIASDDLLDSVINGAGDEVVSVHPDVF